MLPSEAATDPMDVSKPSPKIDINNEAKTNIRI